MPLPSENVEWPPPELRNALRIIDEWDVWYGGDVDQIAEKFRELQSDAKVPTDGHRNWRFWSRRTPSTQSNSRRERLHIPLPGDIAATSADMLFSSNIDLLIPEAREEKGEGGELRTTQERLDVIAEQGGLLNRLLEAAEEASALGSIYLRPTWDRDVADHPILTHVTPEKAVPTFRFGVLTEVTFTRVVSDPEDKEVWRHLEHHSVNDSRALIENALFRGSEDRIGERRDLDQHPFTADLEDAITLNVPGLAVRYVKNMGPARRLRGSHHGRSDFDGIESLFDSVDEAWNSWMRDIRLGRSRLIVPNSYLERGPVGSGAYFDIDQELYTGLEIEPGGEHAVGIEQVQFNIRFAEHKASIEALVAEAVGKAGYSAQTFGLQGDGSDMTATEVRARQDKTFRTTAKKRRYWEPPTEDVLEIMLAIDAEMLEHSDTKVHRPDIEWPDLAAPSAREMAETIQLLAAAEAASTEVLVRMQHPDWSNVEVVEEVAKIVASRPDALPDMFAVGDEGAPEDVAGDATPRELAEIVQKIYLGVGTVLSEEEAREILREAGADLGADFEGTGRTGRPR